jgi:hypothetical protein
VGIGGSGGLDPIKLKGDVTFLSEAKTNTGRSEPAVGFSKDRGPRHVR